MSVPEIESLRPLKALRLLTIWQELGKTAETELERCLLCNAQVLSESCYLGKELVFPDRNAVLSALTTREMEALLCRLADAAPGASPPEQENPQFDRTRFDALRGG